MPLQGTFDVLDFSEVLHLLALHQLTGRLSVRHRSFGANLFLEEGLLTGADQSEHQTAAASGDVTGRLEEVCFEMLEAERGSFEFHPGKASVLPLSAKLPVEAVLEQAGKRLAEWRELQEAIPSLELQPRVVLELGQAEVTLDKERWRVLTSIDGRRNLRALGRVVNLSDFDVCRVIRGLIDEGVCELDGLAALSASTRDAMPVVPAAGRASARSDESGSHAIVVVEKPSAAPRGTARRDKRERTSASQAPVGPARADKKNIHNGATKPEAGLSDPEKGSAAPLPEVDRSLPLPSETANTGPADSAPTADGPPDAASTDDGPADAAPAEAAGAATGAAEAEEPTSLESTSLEPTSLESTDVEPTDTESTDTESTDPDPTDTESTDTDPTDAETATSPAGAQAGGTPTADAQPAGDAADADGPEQDPRPASDNGGPSTNGGPDSLETATATPVGDPKPAADHQDHGNKRRGRLVRIRSREARPTTT